MKHYLSLGDSFYAEYPSVTRGRHWFDYMKAAQRGIVMWFGRLEVTVNW